MQLVVLVGLPGVGKFSVARRICEQLGYRNFHNHLVVDALLALFEFGSPPFVELRELIWTAMLKRAVRAGIEGVVFTVAFDRSVDRRFLLDLSANIGDGADIRMFQLWCDDEGMESRITAADRRAYHKLSSLAEYSELAENGAFDGPDVPASARVIDTTGMTVDAVAAIIVGDLASQSS